MTHRRQQGLHLLWILMLSLLTSASLQAKVLYRWLNDQGATETSYAVPPGLAHRGYEILDGSSMRVLSVVPPEMSEQEYRDKLVLEEALSECEQALDRVRFLYEKIEDINKAEAAALRSLDVRVQNAQQNLTNGRRMLSDYEAQAARQERQGATIEKTLLLKLEQANSLIASLEREIRQRATDKERMKLDYEEERRIFNEGSCTAENLPLN